MDLVKNAQSEIMLILPTINALTRQVKINAIFYIHEAARQRNVKVRILMPLLSDLTERNIVKEKFVVILDKKKKINHIGEANIPDDISNDKISSSKFIDIRYIEPMSETRFTILLIDRKFSLVMELKDDANELFDEAIGLSIYSNSEPGVFSYVSIFENLWTQTELYNLIKGVNVKLELANDKLDIHNKILNEFIHIAAHELRNPIQPILGLSQVLKSKFTQEKEEQISIDEATSILDIIIRNAKKMNMLTDNVLDIAKIEAKTLDLKKETFDLKELIQTLVDDFIRENNTGNTTDGNNYRDIKLSLIPLPIFKEKEQKVAPDLFLIKADKGRIAQVISNLLNNAFKFTNKGNTIIIDIKKECFNGMEDVIVNIIDTGSGIDSEILPRLFTKFASKSARGGTGLGLFLSKCIIEAHSGKIWARNNRDGNGATFGFSLHIVNQ